MQRREPRVFDMLRVARVHGLGHLELTDREDAWTKYIQRGVDGAGWERSMPFFGS